MSDSFTETNKFSSTDSLTISNQFSKFYEFSPSLLSGILNPSCEVFEDDKVFWIDYCNYTAKNEKLVYILYVLTSNFTEYKDDESGSAIHLINYGILCNGKNFIDCVSFSVGGTTYINNTFSIQNNATFVGVLFLRCIGKKWWCYLYSYYLWNLQFSIYKMSFWIK